MSPSMHKQSGSMLVIAIFVIVVMALLGVAMVRLTSTASETVVTEVYGLRALNAARAGVNAILLQEFPHGGGSGSCAQMSNSLASVRGLENCAYTANCETAASSISIAGSPRTLLRFQSVGTCDAGEFVVSRTVTLEALR